MSRSLPLWAVIALSIIGSALIGWMDHNAEEVQGTVLLLLVVAGAMAFVAPRHAWIAALLLGLGPQGAAIVASALGMPARFPMTPAYGGLLALIPAAIGAGIGAVIRQSISRSPTPSRR